MKTKEQIEERINTILTCNPETEGYIPLSDVKSIVANNLMWVIENVEITLNDVNVSGCEYLNNSKEGLLCTLYDYNVFYDMRCADNPDCYYKRLQREKQKNKKLTEDFNEICKRHNEAFEEFNKLKQTNEKLRKTLKDIEEIAKTKIYTPVCFDTSDCPKNSGVGFEDKHCNEYCPIITIEKILGKIKEVENERQV